MLNSIFEKCTCSLLYAVIVNKKDGTTPFRLCHQKKRVKYIYEVN